MIKNINLVLLLILTTLSSLANAQTSYATWTKKAIELNNGLVRRIIKLPEEKGNFLTTSYAPLNQEFKYFKKTNPDFQFEVNDKIYTGTDSWGLRDIKTFTDTRQGNGAAVKLLSEDKKIELTIQFLLYPNLPLIRKNLIIKNLTEQSVRLESVDVEKFEVVDYYGPTFSWIFHDYGRRRFIGPYKGNMQDALVTVHNSDWKQGIVIGNEASGVIKHTSVFWQEPTIVSGLSHKNDRFPFRRNLSKGESFSSPQVFTIVYGNQKDANETLNTVVPDYLRKHMGIRLSELATKPTFVYNTWTPFTTNINEKLVMELARAAAAAGMKEFVIDDGWQDNYGDWGIDKTKFPNGLKPVFDYIKSLGMKPGLWVSVGSASSVSKVYREHPEWFVKDKKGEFANLQISGNSMDVRSACFSTGWKDYIQNILMKLSLDYGLEYLKLDFAVVTSPYRFNNEEAGCYSTSHTGHKDQRESLYVNYESVWQLFDELHKAKPSLFIDCTFEAMGGLQLIDYAMLKHAEGNWLSNFGGHDENVDLKIRNMAWWRSPAIPATALVIGNPEMQDENWELHIKSLAGALPIMLGDPRKLSAVQLKTYRGYADWLQNMETKYKVMMFRQDLPGFGEPVEGMWDGFQRINTESKTGGIIGVFRHGAIEARRIITINYLDPLATYKVMTMGGNIIATSTGKELKENGFPVSIDVVYGGELFELEKIK
ncbi:alpha-galactosidase [Pedobacter frigiditerrae]|uniref:Alpha-galactosidase n=1 Tax=Pedobacter frigiditerrae TaxID=2530452 RepID=A0A4R0MPP7_9SPHI|nr:alpha-galactosidase [Pedobacter frigiditerrae]TCC88805.1 alpha-galactosidase [Pedobacter frigiditerrae]